MTPEEQQQIQRARRGRNIALAVALAGLAFLFYAITFARIGG